MQNLAENFSVQVGPYQAQKEPVISSQLFRDAMAGSRIYKQVSPRAEGGRSDVHGDQGDDPVHQAEASDAKEKDEPEPHEKVDLLVKNVYG